MKSALAACHTPSNHEPSCVPGPPHLADVDPVVDRPGGLETLQHALLEGLGQPVDPDEVLQVLGAGVVERASRVHPLDDGRHVTEHHRVHQR